MNHVSQMHKAAPVKQRNASLPCAIRLCNYEGEKRKVNEAQQTGCVGLMGKLGLGSGFGCGSGCIREIV
jgi:hypothetical protein